MNKRIVAIDCDGVLVDWTQEAVDLVNLHLDTKHTVNDITDFHFDKCLGKKSRKIIYKELITSRHLYDDREPVEGCTEALEILREKYRVICVSSVVAQHAESKMKWLYRHGFEHHDIFFAHDKSLIDFDILIDDKKENILEAVERGILFRRPWNRDLYIKKWHIDRGWVVHNWKEVPDAVYKILQQKEDEYCEDHISESILEEAQRLVSYGKRNKDYGPPETNDARIAKMWSAILDYEIHPRFVSLLMIAVKISREVHCPNRDNRVDMAGYSLINDIVTKANEK